MLINNLIRCFSSLGSIVAALLGTGCDGASPPNVPANPKSFIDTHSSLHNYTVTKIEDWTLESWTIGATILPGRAINVGLRLTSLDPPKVDQIEATMIVNLNSMKDNNLNRSTRRQVTFQKIERQDFQFLLATRDGLKETSLERRSGWEAYVEDVANTDFCNPRATELPEGQYLLDIKLLVKDQPAIVTIGIPIEIVHHLRFHSP